jgi:hypothetical protein
LDDGSVVVCASEDEADRRILASRMQPAGAVVGKPAVGKKSGMKQRSKRRGEGRRVAT